MSATSRREELRRRTGVVSGRQAFLEHALRRRSGEPPAIGDLFVVGGSAGQAVQWAVVERHRRRGLLVIPADANPLIGSSDLPVAESTTGTPLALRCRVGVWVEPARLEPALRTGRLAPADVRAALRKRGEVAAGELRPSSLSEEVDESLEYLEWIAEIVEPAHHALANPPLADEPSSGRRPGLAPTRWLSRPGRLLAQAASILLLVGLGFAGGSLWRQRALDEPGSAQRLTAAPVVNLPIVPLSPWTLTRQAAEESEGLLLPDTAKRFAVWLALRDVDAYEKYRLEILAPPDGEKLWETSELVASTIGGARYLSLELPRDLFAGGEYRLIVHGLADGGEQLLHEYRLALRLR